MHVIAVLWDRISGTQPQPPAWVIGLTGLVALVVVLNTQVWRLAGKVITIAHEGGHALVSVLSGRRLDGIRLHSDSSGVTYSRGRRTGPGLVLTAAAGYVMPSLLGAGAFLGNAVMGLIFGYLYRRWGRVMPLIIAHFLIDAVTFVGYALLAGHVSWLPRP